MNLTVLLHNCMLVSNWRIQNRENKFFIIDTDVSYHAIGVALWYKTCHKSHIQNWYCESWMRGCDSDLRTFQELYLVPLFYCKDRLYWMRWLTNLRIFRACWSAEYQNGNSSKLYDGSHAGPLNYDDSHRYSDRLSQCTQKWSVTILEFNWISHLSLVRWINRRIQSLLRDSYYIPCQVLIWLHLQLVDNLASAYICYKAHDWLRLTSCISSDQWRQFMYLLQLNIDIYILHSNKSGYTRDSFIV